MWDSWHDIICQKQKWHRQQVASRFAPFLHLCDGFCPFWGQFHHPNTSKSASFSWDAVVVMWHTTTIDSQWPVFAVKLQLGETQAWVLSQGGRPNSWFPSHSLSHTVQTVSQRTQTQKATGKISKWKYKWIHVITTLTHWLNEKKNSLLFIYVDLNISCLISCFRTTTWNKRGIIHTHAGMTLRLAHHAWCEKRRFLKTSRTKINSTQLAIYCTSELQTASNFFTPPPFPNRRWCWLD